MVSLEAWRRVDPLVKPKAQESLLHIVLSQKLEDGALFDGDEFADPGVEEG